MESIPEALKRDASLIEPTARSFGASSAGVASPAASPPCSAASSRAHAASARASASATAFASVFTSASLSSLGGKLGVHSSRSEAGLRHRWETGLGYNDGMRILCCAEGRMDQDSTRVIIGRVPYLTTLLAPSPPPSSLPPAAPPPPA
eukprot:5095618-Pyramimonas_sp.AAC.1